MQIPTQRNWKEWHKEQGKYPDAPGDAYRADGSMDNLHPYWQPKTSTGWNESARTGGGRKGGYKGKSGVISCPIGDLEWLRKLGRGNARLGLRVMVFLGREMDQGKIDAVLGVLEPDALGPNVAARVYPPVMDNPADR